MSVSSTTYSPKTNNAWKIFAIILVVNSLQSVFTPLSNDEPYYLLYAQHLSWGYFDHPPMIALLIKMGTALLPCEIGFRLFSMLLGCFTCFFTYRIIEGETNKPVNFSLAALLIFSSLFINLYSFLALPDTPLLFFATLFLYTYRNYKQNDNLRSTIILGVVTALMLYSKYHGVLLIGFTILADFKLFKKPSFYVIIGITLLLLLPHIYWQIQNDYPSIRFQLFERSKLDPVIDKSFLPKQLAVTGPVILLLFSILYKPQTQFQKTLKYNVAGIFIFFFISSFKGLVNVHWTAIAWPGMICLSYLYIVNWKKNKQYVKALLLLNVLALIVIRVDLVANVFRFLSYNENNPKVMTAILKDRSKGYPLVFSDMYNEPTFYTFYQHETAYAINSMYYKKTQFNYLPQLEDQFQGKTVSFISSNPVNKSSQKVSIPKGNEYYVTFIPNFTSFTTGIKVSATNFKLIKAGIKNTIRISVANYLNKQRTQNLILKKGYIALNMTNKKTAQNFTYRYDKPFNPDNKNELGFIFTAPVQKGDYTCVFSIMSADSFLPGFNSNIYTVKIR